MKERTIVRRAARPPANDASHATGPLNKWPYFVSAAGRLVATSVQISVSFLPTSGVPSSHRGGGGSVTSWLCKLETSEYIEVASDVTTMTIGPNVDRDADQPDQQCRPAIAEAGGETEMQRIQHHRQDRRPDQNASKGQHDPAAGVNQHGDQPDSKRGIEHGRGRRRVARVWRVRVHRFFPCCRNVLQDARTCLPRRGRIFSAWRIGADVECVDLALGAAVRPQPAAEVRCCGGARDDGLMLNRHVLPHQDR